jgi:homoserine O-acetyltransferase/O-succinyltransferase
MPTLLRLLALAVLLFSVDRVALAQSELIVEKKMFTIENFRLESGAVLPHAVIAYETYGTLAADGRNAVLLAHGFTSNHHAAGRYAAGDAETGWWDPLIGQGRAIDTDRLFVISTNMLGSSYGSTNPASLDPKTGKAYGPDFPEITLVDIVTAQKRLLDALGVKHLVAVAGPSYGGYQTFQWGVTYPDMMDALVAVVSAPKGNGTDDRVAAMRQRFATDPNWNGGWYYEKGGIVPTMTALRIETLKRYGADEVLAQQIADAEKREAALRSAAEKWAHEFDANGMLRLAHASSFFDAEKDFAKMRAKLLYVLSSTDKLFPPSIAPDIMGKLKAAGVDATFFELKSPYGHLASRADADKWAPTLKAFLAPFMPARS